jgi:hypothetical protein
MLRRLFEDLERMMDLPIEDREPAFLTGGSPPPPPGDAP